MNNTPKICHVAYTHYEGDPRVKREAETLSDLGYDVEFLCLTAPSYSKHRTHNNVKIISMSPERYRGNNNLKYILSYFHFFLCVFVFFLKNPLRYKVIHFHTMPDFIVFSALVPRLLGVKIIIDFHDIMHSLYQNRFKDGSVINLIKFQTKLSAIFSHKVITVNNSCLNIYKSLGIPEEKISIIYNFPDSKLFKPHTSPKNSDHFKLICHGTIMERLGFDVLVKSIARIREEIPGLKLSIIGSGDYDQNIRSLISELDLTQVVDFPNKRFQVHEIPEIIKEHDLGIVPTKIGPGTDIMLPLKLLEYVSMRIPVISTPLQEVKSILPDSALIYANSDDVEDLANKIKYFYKNRSHLEPIMINGLDEFNQQFNWLKETIKLKKIYKEIF